jgi:hypothetical protein
MPNAGHAIRYTEGNDRKGIKPKPVLPTPQDVAILRRAAAGYIIVTMQHGWPSYTYEDGSPVTLHGNGQKHFVKLVAEGWLIPDKGDALFPDDPQPQIYRARKAKLSAE